MAFQCYLSPTYLLEHFSVRPPVMIASANEITEFELDSKSEIEDDEDNFEVTDSCSSSKNESCD